MLAVLIALLAAGAAMVLTLWIDQRWLVAGSVGRAIFAALVLALGVWTVTVIHTALWLEVPGAYGPVQYWHNAEGWMGFFQVRVVTMFFNVITFFLFAPGVLVWAVIETFVTNARRSWRCLIVPLVAVAVYALGLWTMMEYQFYPTA